MDSLTVVPFDKKTSADKTLCTLLSDAASKVNWLSPHQYLNLNEVQKSIGTNLLFLLDQKTLTDNEILAKLQRQISEAPFTVNYCILEWDVRTENFDILRKFEDFIYWPCCENEFCLRLRRLNCTNKNRDGRPVDSELLHRFTKLNLIGRSPLFVKTLAMIEKVSRCDAPVLLRGETGTGKENAARAIHYLGQRSDRAFIPVNCGALPDELLESELFGHEKGAFTDAKTSQKGLVEIANGGTLFLDEVDSLSMKAQTALLRFLQTREYRPIGGKTLLHADVRIISATNSDLTACVEDKCFREDLLFRLNVMNVAMPPLRERSDDIPRIAQGLLQKFSRQYDMEEKKLSNQSIDWLMGQSWPGNVRELENTLLREFLLSEDSDIHIAVDGKTTDQKAQYFSFVDTRMCFNEAKSHMINVFEKEYLQAVLAESGGNVSAAARLAGKERRALGKLLKKYNIDKSSFQSSDRGAAP